MTPFQTLLHPTDFDDASKEAFRVARSLAQAVGARVVVLHVVPPPAIIDQDGRVILDPKKPQPIDLWQEYRRLAADTAAVPVQYAIAVGDWASAKSLLEAKIRDMGEGAFVVMGTHARAGISRLLWGSKAEEVVRDCPCPVLIVKANHGAALAPAKAEAAGVA